MNNFIKVTGKDPHYPSLEIEMLISIRSIVKIYPVYGIKGRYGVYDRCPPVDEDAVFLGYCIQDRQGATYTCYDPAELEKLGLSETDITSPQAADIKKR